MTEQQKANDRLADLMELEEGLAAWEIKFIESVRTQESPVTGPQVDLLYLMHERLC